MAHSKRKETINPDTTTFRLDNHYFLNVANIWDIIFLSFFENLIQLQENHYETNYRPVKAVYIKQVLLDLQEG